VTLRRGVRPVIPRIRPSAPHRGDKGAPVPTQILGVSLLGDRDRITHNEPAMEEGWGSIAPPNNAV
jgi:hypothetical protein